MIGTIEAILIVCSIADKDREKFGKVKLNKAMFFAELDYYLQTGERLTDTIYVKDSFGPVVQRLDAFLGKMEQDKMLHLRLVDNTGIEGKRTEIRCLKSPTLSTDDRRYKKLKIVTQNLIENYNASTVSDLSHDKVYDFFEMGEVIDFGVARAIKTRCEDEKTEEWARSFPMDFAY